MNVKILSILSVFILIFSCKKTQENTLIDENNTSQEITESDISKIDYIDFALDERTEQVIEGWQEYEQLQDIIINVKKGDLSFFKSNEEAIKTLIKDLKTNIPIAINTPATLSRIQVLETKILKLESLYNLTTTSKEELNKTIKAFFVSASNLNFQINKKLEKDSQPIVKPE